MRGPLKRSTRARRSPSRGASAPASSASATGSSRHPHPCSPTSIAFVVPSGDGATTELITYVWHPRRRVLWRKASGSHLAEGVDDFSITYFDGRGRTLPCAAGAGLRPPTSLVRRVELRAVIRCAAQTASASWQVSLPCPPETPRARRRRAGLCPARRPAHRRHRLALDGDAVAAALSSSAISSDDAAAARTADAADAGVADALDRLRWGWLHLDRSSLPAALGPVEFGGGSYSVTLAALSGADWPRLDPASPVSPSDPAVAACRIDATGVWGPARRVVHVVVLSTPDGLPRGLVVGADAVLARRPAPRLRPVRGRRRQRSRVGDTRGDFTGRRQTGRRPRLRRSVPAGRRARRRPHTLARRRGALRRRRAGRRLRRRLGPGATGRSRRRSGPGGRRRPRR